MFKHLFFDDRYLFVRENVKRSYGTAELIEDAIYQDKTMSTTLAGSYVFKLDNGKFRMLYQGMSTEADGKKALFCAISDDGIHFKPENIHNDALPEGFIANNQILNMDPEKGMFGEVAYVLEDKFAEPEKRYKLLFCRVIPDEVVVLGDLYVSPDLLSWTKEEGVCWSTEGEPVVGVFYNKKRECYTIISRPAWGVRMLGYNETKDWKTFTKHEWCLQSDSLDSPLEEIYGMPAFEYDGIYVGFTYMYGGFESCMSAKYSSGTMKSQLSYSWNGINWLRSIREPFLSGIKPDKTATNACIAPMVWPTMIRRSDGNIYIYATAATKEHGPAFHTKGNHGRIFVYKLREDGFIKMESEDPSKESILATRENVWHSGDLHLNIKAKKATVAVYKSDRGEDMGMNILGECEIIEGLTHDDCIPFSGDMRDWVPQFTSGKTLDEFKGSVLAFEIKFTDGEIYSVSGDMTPVFNAEGERWRQTKHLPDYL